MKPFLAFFLFLSYTTCFAGNFEQYFESKALRIDYIHSGNADKESFKIVHYIAKPEWSGSKVNLIDTFDYGKHKIVVRDSVSNRIIFSRGFSTLFDEWRTTPGCTSTNRNKDFEETFLMPYPRNTVLIEFYSRDEKNNWELNLTSSLNPRNISITRGAFSAKAIPLHYTGDPSQRLDLVIIPDGYAVRDTLAMKRDFEKIKLAILNCEPYKSHASQINIWAVKVISSRSGVSAKNNEKNTPAGLSFYALDLDRYMMTEKVHALHDLIGNVPYEEIIIMGNTQEYGGGGIYNFYATSTQNELGDYVITHELGHTLAGLADEYYSSDVTVENFYPLDVEPWEPNITSLVAFDQKWKNMLEKDTPIPTPSSKKLKIGVYEGAGYRSKGLYRPRKNCSMKDAEYDNFCPVCTQVIENMIDFQSK